MSPIQRSQDDVDSASKEINYETDTDGIIQNSSCIVSFLHLIQDLKVIPNFKGPSILTCKYIDKQKKRMAKDGNPF